jgi:hypothetical protein
LTDFCHSAAVGTDLIASRAIFISATIRVLKLLTLMLAHWQTQGLPSCSDRRIPSEKDALNVYSKDNRLARHIIAELIFRPGTDITSEPIIKEA